MICLLEPHVSNYGCFYLCYLFRYEDLRALDGGDDGMAVIKMLIQLATHILKPEGTLWLEVDPSHPELIARYLDSHSYWQLKLVATYPDLFGHERFVEIQRL